MALTARTLFVLSLFMFMMPVYGDSFSLHIYNQEGHGEVSALVTELPLDGLEAGSPLLVQARECEVFDTQGRPLHLKMMPLYGGKKLSACFLLSGFAPDAEIIWEGQMEFAPIETVFHETLLSPQGGILHAGGVQIPYSFTGTNTHLLKLRVPQLGTVDDVKIIYQGEELSWQWHQDHTMSLSRELRLSVPERHGLRIRWKETVPKENPVHQVRVSLYFRQRTTAASSGQWELGDFILKKCGTTTIEGQSLSIYALRLKEIKQREDIRFQSGNNRKIVLPEGTKLKIDNLGDGWIGLILKGKALPHPPFEVDIDVPAVLKTLDVAENIELHCKGELPLPPVFEVNVIRRQ